MKDKFFSKEKNNFACFNESRHVQRFSIFEYFTWWIFLFGLRTRKVLVESSTAHYAEYWLFYF